MVTEVYREQAVDVVEHFVEWLSFEMLHNVEVSEVGNFAEVVVNSYDVVVALRQRRSDLNLSHKAGAHVFVGEVFRLNNFNNASGVAFEVDVFGAVKDSKAPLGELANQSIFVGDHHQWEAALPTEVESFSFACLTLEVTLAIGTMFRVWAA